MEASSAWNSSLSRRSVRRQRLSRSTCIRCIGSTYGLRSRIERCSVRSPSRSCGAALELQDQLTGKLKLGANFPKIVLQPRLGELVVEGGDAEIRPGEHCLHVVEEGGEEKPVRDASARGFRRPCCSIMVFSPVPTPNQPGRMWRDWVQAKTHGTARNESKSLRSVRDGARLPICILSIASTGVAWRKYSKKAGSPVTSRSYAARLAAARVVIASR